MASEYRPWRPPLAVPQRRNRRPNSKGANGCRKVPAWSSSRRKINMSLCIMDTNTNNMIVSTSMGLPVRPLLSQHEHRLQTRPIEDIASFSVYSLTKATGPARMVDPASCCPVSYLPPSSPRLPSLLSGQWRSLATSSIMSTRMGDGACISRATPPYLRPAFTTSC